MAKVVLSLWLTSATEVRMVVSLGWTSAMEVAAVVSLGLTSAMEVRGVVWLTRLTIVLVVSLGLGDWVLRTAPHCVGAQGYVWLLTSTSVCTA